MNSALFRSISFRYKTNLAIVCVSTIATLACILISKDILVSINAGVVTFLTWALLREIMPISSWLSIVVSIFLSFLYLYNIQNQELNILLLITNLVVLRAFGRLNGNELNIFDLILVSTLVFISTYLVESRLLEKNLTKDLSFTSITIFVTFILSLLLEALRQRFFETRQLLTDNSKEYVSQNRLLIVRIVAILCIIVQVIFYV